MTINPTDLEVEQITRDMGFTHEQLFDQSPEADEIYEPQFNDNLTSEQLESAYHLVKYSRGVMLVTGPPGAGKDLFANYLAFWLKTLFKGKKVLRDDRPRELFGPYIPFTEGVIINELIQQQQLITDGLPAEIARADMKTKKYVASMVNSWMNDRGIELLYNSVLYLTEFRKYVHNRKPFSPMGLLIADIAVRWRHLDILIIGTTPSKREVDRISILPHVTHEVRCNWMATRPDTTACHIYFPKYISARGVLEARGKPRRLLINGRRPRDILNGGNYYNLYVSKNTTGTRPTQR